MKTISRLLPHLLLVLLAASTSTLAQSALPEVCPRSTVGSVLPEPEDLRSENGLLKVEFAYRSTVDAQGLARYCYIYKDGAQSPTLRVKPGDQVTLVLKNELPAAGEPSDRAMPMGHGASSSSCAAGAMTAAATNLHFHGLVLPPVCHQDDTLHTLIAPAESYEYKFQIPLDQPPGLYWYHPHIHGFVKTQILGGASGALVVEGLETVNSQVSGLPERVLIIRDQDLIHPDAAPVNSSSMPAPQVLRDAEGDILNAGTGTGKPAKDLSLNFVPVPYPDYQPAIINMKPLERQLWRVLNASAITYVDLQVLFNDRPQFLGVVALDGVPINANGNDKQEIMWKGHILLPPASRAEFIVKGPPAGAGASLVTRSVDTGPAGENDPTRPLARIVAAPDATEPRSLLPVSSAPATLGSHESLANLKPVRQRKLYFTEHPRDLRDPNSPTVFMLTVDGQPPAPFDPSATLPNLTVQQGDVEDWIVENRTNELHDFHIHQIHFQMLEWNGVPVNEPFLRDTVNVAYWDGHSPVYPSVKLRMDFRNPNMLGTFVYHCHLLEHEDGGMMGTIQVQPALKKETLSSRDLIPH